VQAFLEQFGGVAGPSVVLLQSWGGGVSALTTLDDLWSVPPQLRGSTRAIDLGIPLESLPVVGPGETAEAAIRRMEDGDAKWVLVVDAGHIVGAISEPMFLKAAAAGSERPHPEPAEVVRSLGR
jgi:CBS domain-containing protein